MRRPHLLVTLAASALVLLAVLGARDLGWLQGAELAVYDQYVRRATPEPVSPSRVLLVEVRESDIREQGHWPLSDAIMASALRKLAAAKPHVIGLDIYRDLPVPPGESQLAHLLSRESRIIAVRKFGDDPSDAIPGPPVLEGGRRVGFNDLLLDPDHTVRRGLLFLDSGGSEVDYAFALRVALMELAAHGTRPSSDPERPEWLRLGSTTLRPFETNDGGYAWADSAGYQFLIDFAGADRGLERVSLGQVLRDEVDPRRVRDRIVLVGVNAESLPDFFRVPVSIGNDDGTGVPGVELHGYIVDQLVRHGLGESRPIRFVSDRTEALIVALMAVMGCALGLGTRWRPAAGVSALLGTAVFGIVALWGLGAVAFRAGVWIPVVAPGLAWLGGVGIVNAWRSSRERAQREVLMGLFSRYLSSEIADEIWRHRDQFFRDGRPRTQRLTATILFVDIKGYSSRAEKMDPEALLSWINDFMGSMAATVGRWGGVVDDYFGDGMMALFGVPFARTTEREFDDDARRAVRCAIEMASALEVLNAGYRERELPTVQMRIGIHTGPVVAGSLGSAERLKYTVMGDTVVIGKRLEGLGAVEHDFEAAACRILISDRTEARLDDDVNREALGSYAVKGKHEEVVVYRVVP